MSEEIRTRAQADEALDSFEPGTTKRAVRYLVDVRDHEALPRILPLTQHPDAAIRFVAKRAVKELRSLAVPVARDAVPVRIPLAPEVHVEEQILPQAVGAPRNMSGRIDPRLEALLARPAVRRERKPRDGGVPLRWFDLEL